MKHFVLVERLGNEQMHYGGLCDKLVEILQPLNTLTFYKHQVSDSDFGLKSLHKMLLEKPMIVRFVDCVLNAFVAWFDYFSERNGWDSKAGNLEVFCWDLSLPRGNRTLDTEAFRTMDATIVERYGGWENCDCEVFNKWLVPRSLDDLTAFVWSYPAEQLQWLKSCLESLETIVNADVASLIVSTYEAYDESRQSTFGSKTDESVKKMGLRWKSHDLDVVDCAFLARLLSMTPGVPEPPYDLPKDIYVLR